MTVRARALCRCCCYKIFTRITNNNNSNKYLQTEKGRGAVFMFSECTIIPVHWVNLSVLNGCSMWAALKLSARSMFFLFICFILSYILNQWHQRNRTVHTKINNTKSEYIIYMEICCNILLHRNIAVTMNFVLLLVFRFFFLNDDCLCCGCRLEKKTKICGKSFRHLTHHF